MTRETAEKESGDSGSRELLPVLLALFLIFLTIGAITHLAQGEFPERLDGDMLAHSQADYGPDPQDDPLFLPLDARIIREVAADETGLRVTPAGRPAAQLAAPIPIAELPEAPPSPTPTPEPPPVAGAADSPTPTATPGAPTATATPRPTGTSSPTPTGAPPTPTASAVPALLPSPTATATPTALPPSPTAAPPQPAGNTPTPTDDPPTPTATSTPTPVATATATATAAAAATATPTGTPLSGATIPPRGTPSPTATPPPSPTPTPVNIAAPTSTSTPSPTSTPAPSLPLQPKIECVRAEGDGTYTAVFGYLNVNEQPITVPIGAGNHFTPLPANRGQPTVFQHGRHHAVFSVNFDGSPLAWTLYGHTATASSDGDSCN